MADTMRPAVGKFTVLVVLLTVLAMSVTVAVTYVVTEPPRSMLAWVTMGFLCVVEFIAAMLALNVFARARAEHRPSGAVMAGMWRVLGLYLVLGSAAIGIFAFVRDEQGAADPVFAGVFAALTTVLFIVAAIVFGFDLLAEARQRPINQTRQAHESMALSLAPTLATLRSARFDDPTLLAQRLTLIKRLESIDTALRHSHGGGVGSWEHGRAEHDPAQPAQLREWIAAIDAEADQLAAASDVDKARAMMDRMTGQIVKVEGSIESMGLA